MTKNVITEQQKKVARYAKAMGHPIRMYVLELLSNQSCCYSGDLSEILPIAKSTLSQHLKEQPPGSNIVSIKKTGKKHRSYLRCL